MTLSRFVISFSIIAVTAVITPLVVHAESVQWGENVPRLARHHPSSGECVPMLDAAHATIQYNAEAYDDAGTNICGATIARGTHITFKFTPHTYEDIYWFGTGFYSDSPYGDWVADAASPPVAEMCAEKNFYASNYQVTANQWADFYGTLSVDPPEKSLTGTNGLFTCGSLASDGTVSCTASAEGSATPVFQFGPTYGRYHILPTQQPVGQCTPSEPHVMYPAGSISNAGGGRGWYNCTGGNTEYKLDVPAQSISCPIEVVITNETPTAPVVTPVPPPSNPPGSPAVAGGACIVGTPYSISMTSTDPRAESLRYGIDWDNNSTIDEFVPGSGYAPSGTTLTASRTYSTTGTKKIKVLAQNSKGMASGWTSITFSCAAAPEDATGEFSAIQSASGLDDNDVAATPDLALRLIPSIVKKGNSTKVIWSATNVKSCIVDALNGDRWTTVISTLGGEPSAPINVQTKYTLTCIDLADQTQTKTATVNILPVWRER
jgi:hypothetical protein